MLSVSVRESDQVITDFISRHGLTYPFLMDRDGSASLDFKVMTTPTTFFLGPDGKPLLEPLPKTAEHSITAANPANLPPPPPPPATRSLKK